MKKNILIYTFNNKSGTTYKLLKRVISEENKSVASYIIPSQNGHIMLANRIKKIMPEFIIGLGDYRKNSKRIRLESRFINKYGKNKIIADGPSSYDATLSLQLGNDAYLASTTSNGPCNRSAYMAAYTVSQFNLNSRVAFIHFPRSNRREKIDKYFSLLSVRIKDCLK